MTVKGSDFIKRLASNIIDSKSCYLALMHQNKCNTDALCEEVVHQLKENDTSEDKRK